MVLHPDSKTRKTARALMAVAAGACWFAFASGAGASGLVGTRAAYTAALAPQASVADATDVRVEAAASTTKLVFTLTAPVEPKAFVLPDPDRAIVDLPQVDFRIDPATGRARDGHGHTAGRRGGLLASYRFGILSPGRSRIVIDLGAPARISVDKPRKVGNAYELTVALSRTDRDSFRAAARRNALPEPAKAAVLAPPPPAAAEKVTIVLDPGHGGPDTGAIVKGVIEKDVALGFARALATKLEAYGSFHVVMTRSDDVFIPLSERVRIARGAGAALMVSIHADTLTEASATDVGGATVYTVSDKASDAYAAKVAAKENSADVAAGLDGQEDTADVNDILFDLTRQETRAYSHVFARTLVNYWKVVGRLNKNPRRAAGFVVLKAPDVPSVLLELGYLSNQADSTSLSSDAWREQAAGRMAEAIEAYFADRHGSAKAAAGVPMRLKQAAVVLRDGQK